MAYTFNDFASCKFNPLEPSFAFIYSDLMECIPAAYTGDKEKLMRYVCLLYDPNSKLIKDTANMEQRKLLAAELAGYDLEDEGQETMDALFMLQDYSVVEVIDHFLKNEVKERLWYLIQGNEQTFYEYGKRLIQPVKWGGMAGKEKEEISAIAVKTKISEDMAAILTRLENDYRKFYADDEKLIKVTAKKRFSPEAQASRVN